MGLVNSRAAFLALIFVFSLVLLQGAFATATINLFHKTDVQELIVFGETPASTAQVKVHAYTTDNMFVPVFDSNSPLDLAKDEYALIIDISGWASEKYNIVALFYDTPSSPISNDLASALFDDLHLLSLQESVDRLNDGSIEFKYDSKSDEVTVLGEAPSNATV